MNKNDFILELKNIDITLSEENLNNLDIYKELLKEYNKKFNLTTIIKDTDIYLKHFYDSLCLLSLNEVRKAKSILDIGTGAGFPGLVIAIVLKDINVVLVESNGKKCNFLKEVVSRLNLNNVTIYNMRAEEYVKNSRELFDVVTSRAVADLTILCELSIPAVSINGYFLPMKAHVDEELNYSMNKIKALGASLEDVVKYRLPYEMSERCIIKIKKIKKTDNIYPRDYSKIIKDLKKVQK